MMGRYSIIGATREDIFSVGGKNISEKPLTGMIYADLSDAAVLLLQQRDFIVNEQQSVKVDILPPVAPPTPRAGEPTYSPSALLDLMGAEDLRKLTNPPLYGKNLNIAVLDTGIRDSHKLVGGNIVYRKNLTISPDGDGFNHGTGIASILRGVAPQAGLLDFKVIPDDGVGSDEGIVDALEECLVILNTNPSIAPTIINLSLGADDDGNPLSAMRVASRAAIAKGMWVSAAAGNSGPASSTIMSPACDRAVFATGSCRYIAGTQSIIVSEFSSRGPTKEGVIKPDAVFFGENIEMASSLSDTATIAKSGTSFSTPFCSGLGLLYRESVIRQALYVGSPIPEYLRLSETFLRWGAVFSLEDLINVYLKSICAKPVDAPATKDNSYGEGLPVGQLAYDALKFGRVLDIPTLITLPMMVMMMIPLLRKL